MQGILIMDKPAGFTSFDVVAKLRGIFGIRKIGHSGTLDPMATGVLPVFIGNAAKAVDLQTNHDKVYEAELLLGTRTDTGDVTGAVLETATVSPQIDAAAVAAVLPRFLGESEQLPPMYSAVKVNGRALYKAADHLTPPEVSLCEPFACVLNAVDNYQPKMGDNVLIIGGGPMGLFHVMVNKYLGASQIIVSNVGEERLLIARDLGATATIDPSTTDLKEYVASLTEGRGADVTVVCIGINALFQQALECTRPKGHVSAFAGFPKGSMSEMDPNLIHYNELVVTGGSNASRANYEKALRLIGEGAINAKALHTDTYALDDLFAALDRVQSGQALKVAVVPEL